MDSEIERWRSIAATASLNQTKRAVLVPKKKVSNHVHETLTKKTNTKRSEPSIEELEKHPYQSILDNAEKVLKKDTERITKGYLNHNTLNQAFEKALILHDQHQKDDMEEKRLKHGGLGSFIDLMEEYDSIQAGKAKTAKSSPSNLSHAPKVRNPPKSTRIKILPNTNLALTKTEQYKGLLAVNDDFIVEKDQFTSSRNLPKDQRLQEYYKQLEADLKELNCPSEGPDVNRLKVYSRLFDSVIQEFKTYGPLLAEIKRVYDAIFDHFQMHESELDTLRAKVQKLLANNENRLLLKLEKRRCKLLEGDIQSLQQQNDKLYQEMKRKLTIYAAYLPDAHLHQKALEDPLLAEIEEHIRKTTPSEDPLSLLETRVETMEKELVEKTQQVLALKKSIESEYVTKVSKDMVDEALTEARDKLTKLTDKNKELEVQWKKAETDLMQMEKLVKEKELQYQVLSKEYTELSEAVALSFDKKLVSSQ